MHEIDKNRLFLCYLPHNVDDYYISCFFSSISFKKRLTIVNGTLVMYSFAALNVEGQIIAASLAEDVTNYMYCVSRGSPIFLCSLDVEFEEMTNFSWLVCIIVLTVALQIAVIFSKCLRKLKR